MEVPESFSARTLTTRSGKRVVLPHERVPRSNSVVERRVRSDSGDPCAGVRCGQCLMLLCVLFESKAVFSFVDYSIVREQCLLVVRRCPRCKVDNQLEVTARPGTPLGVGVPWRCTHCGARLAHVDAARGRLTIRCRCKRDVRFTAADAFATRELQDILAELEREDLSVSSEVAAT